MIPLLCRPVTDYLRCVRIGVAAAVVVSAVRTGLHRSGTINASDVKKSSSQKCNAIRSQAAEVTVQTRTHTHTKAHAQHNDRDGKNVINLSSSSIISSVLTSGRHRIARRRAQLQLNVLLVQFGNLRGAAQQQPIVLAVAAGAVDQVENAAVAEVRRYDTVAGEIGALQVQPQADACGHQSVGRLVVVRFGGVHLRGGLGWMGWVDGCG